MLDCRHVSIYCGGEAAVKNVTLPIYRPAQKRTEEYVTGRFG